MRNNLNKVWFLLVAAVSIVFCTGTANAVPVYDGTYVDMYLKQTTFPAGLTEEKVYLDAASSSTITGHVGSQTDSRTVSFSSSTDVLDAKNGFATIKAQDGYINNITITAPGYWFEDLIFSVNLAPDNPDPHSDLTITAVDSSGGTDAYADWAAKSDWVSGENRILVLSDTGNLMQSVTIDSVAGLAGIGGLDQLKQTEISGLTPAPVPEPATILLLGSGLVGLAGFGRRKFKK